MPGHIDMSVEIENIEGPKADSDQAIDRLQRVEAPNPMVA